MAIADHSTGSTEYYQASPAHTQTHTLTLTHTLQQSQGCWMDKI